MVEKLKGTCAVQRRHPASLALLQLAPGPSHRPNSFAPRPVQPAPSTMPAAETARCSVTICFIVQRKRGPEQWRYLMRRLGDMLQDTHSSAEEAFPDA